MNWIKLKALAAVLLGLLIVGVTAGSASAQLFPTSGPWENKLDTKNPRIVLYTSELPNTPTSSEQAVQKPITPISPEPQVFLDDDQVHLYFNKWDSYKYQGTIYLAFQWWIDASYVPNAGSPDRVSILIPWEVKINSGWVQMFVYDNPSVYIDVDPNYRDEVQIIQEGEGFPLIEKTIGGIKYRMKRIVLSIPENDIKGGTIYLGVKPKTEFDGVKFPVVMGYVHTWSWEAFASIVLSTAISGGVSIAFPPASPLGAIAESAFASFVAYEVVGLLPTDKYWDHYGMFDVTVSYSAYPEKQYPPSFPPCVHGICPTNIIPGVESGR